MTTQRKARTGLGRHRGFSSREPEQRCRAGAATSNHDTGCQLLCCFFLLIFAFYPTLFFLCLRTLLPPLTTDRRITPNLPDCPQPKVTDRYPLGRRVGHYDVPGAEGSGASSAERRSGRHVPPVGGLGPFLSSERRAGKDISLTSGSLQSLGTVGACYRSLTLPDRHPVSEGWSCTLPSFLFYGL